MPGAGWCCGSGGAVESPAFLLRALGVVCIRLIPNGFRKRLWVSWCAEERGSPVIPLHREGDLGMCVLVPRLWVSHGTRRWLAAFCLQQNVSMVHCKAWKRRDLKHAKHLPNLSLKAQGVGFVGFVPLGSNRHDSLGHPKMMELFRGGPGWPRAGLAACLGLAGRLPTAAQPGIWERSG